MTHYVVLQNWPRPIAGDCEREWMKFRELGKVEFVKWHFYQLNTNSYWWPNSWQQSCAYSVLSSLVMLVKDLEWPHSSLTRVRELISARIPRRWIDWTIVSQISDELVHLGCHLRVSWTSTWHHKTFICVWFSVKMHPCARRSSSRMKSVIRPDDKRAYTRSMGLVYSFGTSFRPKSP